MNDNAQLQTTIDAIARCAHSCYGCFTACLNEPDVNDRKSCITSLVECAMLCQMTVAALSINGQFAKELCDLCAKASQRCAQECSSFKDTHCQKCADDCRTCAVACKKI